MFDIHVRRSKLSVIVSSIISIVLGILAFTHPTGATMFITLATGWFLLIGGIVALISSFAHFSILLSQIELFEGLLDFFLGLMIVNWPQFFVAWIFILIGIDLIIFGFNFLYFVNAARAFGATHTGWQTFGGVLMIILGFMVMWSPFMMADVSMIVTGVALVYTGIVGVIEGIKMKSDKSDNRLED